MDLWYPSLTDTPSLPDLLQGSSGTLGYVIRRRAAAHLAFRYAEGNHHHIDFLMLAPVRDGTLQVWRELCNLVGMHFQASLSRLFLHSRRWAVR